MAWQPSLFAAMPTAVTVDEDFTTLERIELDDDAWVDYAPGWVGAPDALFEEIVRVRAWGQRSRRMYDKEVLEPRLTSPWHASSGEPLEPQVVDLMRKVLSDRYGVDFDSAGFNLYRDGRDSVAWHRDRISKKIDRPVVALVGLGDRRKFLMRPYGGGPSKNFPLGAGDLLVTGGNAQRTWEHSIPKVAKAGPRISIAFRHGMDPAVYAGKKVLPASP